MVAATIESAPAYRRYQDGFRGPLYQAIFSADWVAGQKPDEDLPPAERLASAVILSAITDMQGHIMRYACAAAYQVQAGHLEFWTGFLNDGRGSPAVDAALQKLAADTLARHDRKG